MTTPALFIIRTCVVYPKHLTSKVKTSEVLKLLRAYESPNVLFSEPDGSWPIVWERAQGVWVHDPEGRKYLDLTAAFGVAAAGHANPRVVAAGRRQMGRLLHAMGDVHPHAPKARLARELSRVTFERWSAGKSKVIGGKTIFNNSGFEAVEAALKTAALATGKRGIIAFKGAYHGLGYGTLNVTHRALFRGPFLPQLARFGKFVDFPRGVDEMELVGQRIRRLLKAGDIGAILVEPIQVRGGINIPPPGFLRMLRRICDENGALLILDEIYTGFGRTGKWFACEHDGVVPDLICLGKALTGGFPLSACVGKSEIIDAAWPPSRGEAIHTSTFLGHPVGCAMALAQIAEIERLKLVDRSARLGVALVEELRRLANRPGEMDVRGCGLLVGLELREPDGAPATAKVFGIIKKMLRRGYLLLPEGEHGNVISFTPPLTVTRNQLKSAVTELADALGSVVLGS